jgi:hypothetical protein
MIPAGPAPTTITSQLSDAHEELLAVGAAAANVAAPKTSDRDIIPMMYYAAKRVRAAMKEWEGIEKKKNGRRRWKKISERCRSA